MQGSGLWLRPRRRLGACRGAVTCRPFSRRQARKLVRAILLVLAGVRFANQALAQFATVFFSNYDLVAGINAPVFDHDRVTKLGSAYLAQLYWSATGAAGSYVAVADAPVPFRDGAGAGYWNPTGNTPQSSDSSRMVGVTAGSPVWLMVAVWNAAAGYSYESAREQAGGDTGESIPIRVISGGAGSPPSVPSPMIGLTTFWSYVCCYFPLYIANGPTNQTASVGGSVTFSVTIGTIIPGGLTGPASGYRWERQDTSGAWSAIPSGTTASLVLSNLQPVDTGYYHVVVAFGGFRLTSDPALIKVIQPPRISPASGPAGDLKLSLSGAVGDAYLLQSSTDLIRWEEVQIVTNHVGAVTMSDTREAVGWRFYRVSVQ